MERSHLVRRASADRPSGRPCEDVRRRGFACNRLVREEISAGLEKSGFAIPQGWGQDNCSHARAVCRREVRYDLLSRTRAHCRSQFFENRRIRQYRCFFKSRRVVEGSVTRVCAAVSYEAFRGHRNDRIAVYRSIRSGRRLSVSFRAHPS